MTCECTRRDRSRAVEDPPPSGDGNSCVRPPSEHSARYQFLIPKATTPLVIQGVTGIRRRAEKGLAVISPPALPLFNFIYYCIINLTYTAKFLGLRCENDLWKSLQEDKYSQTSDCSQRMLVACSFKSR